MSRHKIVIISSYEFLNAEESQFLTLIPGGNLFCFLLRGSSNLIDCFLGLQHNSQSGTSFPCSEALKNKQKKDGYVRCKYWRKMRYGCKGTVSIILATL